MSHAPQTGSVPNSPDPSPSGGTITPTAQAKQEPNTPASAKPDTKKEGDPKSSAPKDNKNPAENAPAETDDEKYSKALEEFSKEVEKPSDFLASLLDYGDPSRVATALGPDAALKLVANRNIAKGLHPEYVKDIQKAANDVKRENPMVSLEKGLKFLAEVTKGGFYYGLGDKETAADYLLSAHGLKSTENSGDGNRPAPPKLTLASQPAGDPIVNVRTKEVLGRQLQPPYEQSPADPKRQVGDPQKAVHLVSYPPLNVDSGLVKGSREDGAGDNMRKQLDERAKVLFTNYADPLELVRKSSLELPEKPRVIMGHGHTEKLKDGSVVGKGFEAGLGDNDPSKQDSFVRDFFTVEPGTLGYHIVVKGLGYQGVNNVTLFSCGAGACAPNNFKNSLLGNLASDLYRNNGEQDTSVFGYSETITMTGGSRTVMPFSVVDPTTLLNRVRAYNPRVRP